MKKLLIIGAVALLMTGCSTVNHNAVMAEPEVLFTYNGTEYTEDFVFNALVSSDTGSILINELEGVVIKKLREDNDIDITDALNTQLESIKEELGDTYDSYMETYYGSAEAYINEILEPQVFLVEYFSNILREGDLNTTKAQYDMKVLSIYLFSDEESANNVSTLLAESGDLATMEAAITPEGQTSLVYTNKNTSFLDGVVTAITPLKAVNDVGIYFDEEGGYYYVFVVSATDVEDDVIVDTVIQQTDYIDREMAAILKNDFGFKVYDTRLRKQLGIDFSLYLD